MLISLQKQRFSFNRRNVYNVSLRPALIHLGEGECTTALHGAQQIGQVALVQGYPVRITEGIYYP